MLYSVRGFTIQAVLLVLKSHFTHVYCSVQSHDKVRSVVGSCNGHVLHATFPTHGIIIRFQSDFIASDQVDIIKSIKACSRRSQHGMPASSHMRNER